MGVVACKKKFWSPGGVAYVAATVNSVYGDVYVLVQTVGRDIGGRAQYCGGENSVKCERAQSPGAPKSAVRKKNRDNEKEKDT